MRSKYLFELARTCHCDPRTVDALRCKDFFNLITGIDEAIEQAKKQAAQQNGG